MFICRDLMKRIILIILLFWWNFMFSQTDSLNEPDIDLENLLNIKVVAASQTEINVTKAPANVIVISSKELEERGYITLFDLLKDLPGFDFTTGIPSGEYPTHFLFRGIGDVGQTKFVIMIDGIPQNDISNGWVRNIGYNFSLIDIERVEFVSGPGSALYGRNAYAGYINIITKTKKLKDPDKLSVSTNLLTGSYNTISPEVKLAGKIANKMTYQIAGRYYSSKGDNGINRWDPGNYFHNNVEPDSVYTQEYGMIANQKNPDSSSIAIPDGFKTSINDYYVRGKVGDDKVTLGFNFWKKHEGLGNEVVGYEYFTNTPGIDYDVEHSGKAIDLKYKYEINDRISGYAQTYFRNTSVLPGTGFTYTYQYQSVNNGSLITNDKKKRYHSEGFLFGIQQQIKIEISKHNHLVIGGQAEQKVREYFSISIDDLYNYHYKQAAPAKNLVVQPVYYSKNGAAYFQDVHNITKNFDLTLGMRYDMDQIFGNVFNPRIAAVYAPQKGLNVKALYGHGFKAPTIFELFDEWRGSDKLLPEKISTGELQVGYVSKKWGMISAGAFYSALNNLIQVENNPDTTEVSVGPQGQHSYYYQNTGNSAIYGANLVANLKIFNHFFLFGNYQYLSHPNSEIDNIAKNKINLGVNYLLLNKINFNIRANIVGKVKAPASNVYFQPKTQASIDAIGYDYVTENIPDGYLSGHTIINATISGKNLFPDKKWNITPQLIIKNLLNTQYANIGRQSGDGARPVNAIQSTIYNPQGFIPAYHPQPGRTILVSLRFNWN